MGIKSKCCGWDIVKQNRMKPDDAKRLENIIDAILIRMAAMEDKYRKFWCDTELKNKQHESEHMRELKLRVKTLERRTGKLTRGLRKNENER